MPLSSAETVLRYASDFIPAWAGAISIDLLPGVMVFILAVVNGAIRREEEAMPFAERVTVAELMQTVAMQKAVVAEATSAKELRVTEDVLAETENSKEDEDGHKITSIGGNKSPRKGPVT